MAARIVDGKAIAAGLRAELKEKVEAFGKTGRTPGLAVVLVGNDPASAVYVRAKARQTVEAGMRSFEHRLPEDVSQDQLMRLVETLNDDFAVDGILVQLPLPPHIDAAALLSAVDPAKDVDGFHPINAGRLATGDARALTPCTPLGCVHLLKSVEADLSGAHALVLGRSNIVGKPLGQLLLGENCTVTIAHSRTRDVANLCRAADIVIAATGQPEMVRGDWIKRGALVIDVGINRIEENDGYRVIGDVAFDEVRDRAGAITPVPGGVGPMTIAYLLQNTLKAARQRLGVAAI
ncbi:bifunctional methylenetetrahydrofolate dehydrogenase/methenyltetrahydrofolate cyclohydrolase FolD (plasmid) [Bosea vestrisii]|uniref:bifunctional methylenetetrahydrofolate dehydrogenase/methenyltetrahydrofolate cyclohydrolase FolD n=1 Tax=Bosea vestrisii TaxID=151416 RepID=UPI0024DFAA09|nr:bifunctional methylenetetrahydrofolate dehydrogenase/methenyltetrahydrofolate cyclohydrolase FolD [Bosea vestrisii]WID99845.1 bifunctional methylenetetrahydrofolate dehydrogenase/methenyltetrahydrofolate cyclohydrolase FolD [Bosea vestrisii]